MDNIFDRLSNRKASVDSVADQALSQAGLPQQVTPGQPAASNPKSQIGQIKAADTKYQEAVKKYNTIEYKLAQDGGLSIAIPDVLLNNKEIVDSLNEIANIKYDVNQDGTISHPLIDGLDDLNKQIQFEVAKVDIASQNFDGNIEAANSYIKNAQANYDNFAEVEIPDGTSDTGFSNIKYTDFRKQAAELNDTEKSKLYESLTNGANSKDQITRARSISLLDLLTKDTKNPLGSGIGTKVLEGLSGVATGVSNSLTGGLANKITSAVGGQGDIAKKLEADRLKLPDTQIVSGIGQGIGSIAGLVGDIAATQGLSTSVSGALKGTQLVKYLNDVGKFSKIANTASTVAGEVAQGYAIGQGRRTITGEGEGYTAKDLLLDAGLVSGIEYAPKAYKFVKKLAEDAVVGDILSKNNISTMSGIVENLGKDLNDVVSGNKIEELVASGARIGDNYAGDLSGAEVYKGVTRLQAETAASDFAKLSSQDSVDFTSKLETGDLKGAQAILTKNNAKSSVEDLAKLNDALYNLDDAARKASYNRVDDDTGQALSKVDNYFGRSAVRQAREGDKGLTTSVRVAGAGGKRLTKTIGSDLSRTYNTLREAAIGAADYGNTLVGAGVRENVAARVSDSIDRSVNVLTARKLEQNGVVIREATGKALSELPPSGVLVKNVDLPGGQQYKVAFASPQYLTENGYRKIDNTKVENFFNNFGQKTYSPAWVKNNAYTDIIKTFTGTEELLAQSSLSRRALSRLAKVSSTFQNIKLSGGFKNLNAFAYNETLSMLAATPEKAADIMRVFVIANNKVAVQREFLNKADFLKKFIDQNVKINIPSNIIGGEKQLATLASTVGKKELDDYRDVLSEAKTISNAIANKSIAGEYGLTKKASNALDKLKESDPKLFASAVGGNLTDKESIDLYNKYLSLVKYPSAKVIKAAETSSRISNNLDRITDGKLQVGTIAKSALMANGDESGSLKRFIGDVYNKFEEFTGDATFNGYLPLLQVNALESAYNRAIRLGLSEKDAIASAAKTTNRYFNDGVSNKVVSDVLTTFLFAPRYRQTQVSRWLNDALAPFRVLSSVAKSGGDVKKAIAENSIQLTHAVTNILTLSGIAAFTKSAYDKYPWEIKGAGSSFALPLINKETGQITVIDPIGLQTSSLRIGGRLANNILEGDQKGISNEFVSLLSIVGQPLVRAIWNTDYTGQPIRDPDAPAGDQAISLLSYTAGEYGGHPFIKALGGYIKNGSSKDALFQSLELPIRTKDGIKNAKNAFNFEVLPAVEEISAEYSKKILNTDDVNEKSKLQIEMFTKIKDIVNDWKEGYGGILKDTEVNIGTKGLDINDPQKKALLSKAYGAKVTPTFSQEDTQSLADKQSVRSGDLIQLRDSAKTAGIDVGTLLTDLRDTQSRYYGSKKELGYQYENILKEDKDTGTPSFYDVKSEYKKAIDEAYKKKDYDSVERLQNEFLARFDERIKPLIAQYGVESLYQNYNIQKDLSSLLTGFIPYSEKKKAGLKGKPGSLLADDTVQFLQERYGIGGRDKSNLPSDKEVLASLQQITNSFEAGEPARAKSIATRVYDRINNDIIRATEDDYKYIESIVKD